MRMRNYLGYLNALPATVRMIRQYIFNDCLITVLMCHDVPPEYLGRFAEQMNFLKKHYSFIDGEIFKKIMLGKHKFAGFKLLLTFDDGFKSNRVVVDEILNELGIKAIFFIPPNFINCNSDIEVKSFVANNLFPGGMTFEEVPEHMKPMTWDDITYLSAEGHCIGAHTLSHCRLSTIINEEQLRHEIIESGDVLQHRLGKPIEYFAYPFGDITSISQCALNIAQKRYEFIFSGVRVYHR